jgi:redox-sensitive bicupin YhaK (pirin superfamily)
MAKTDSGASSPIAALLKPHAKDLGGFKVQRLLPSIEAQMVGPFIFFDHFGPAIFRPGEGVDVRPHPHIGLATVTYLLEGAMMHRDSLGSVQRIEPGDVNWMTAGAGIVHSERTSPPDIACTGCRPGSRYPRRTSRANRRLPTTPAHRYRRSPCRAWPCA